MLVFGEWWEMLLLLFENSATTYTVYLVVVVFVSTRRIVAVRIAHLNLKSWLCTKC